MTTKHFIQLASAIKGIKDKKTRDDMKVLIGFVCADINGRFNWDRWNAYING